MGFGNSKSKGQVFGEINITPLTDIFLVLLIIMMVVAPMTESTRQDIKPPELENGTEVDPGKLTVEVTSEGLFFVKGEEVAEGDLTEVFQSRSEELEEKNVVIRADKTTKSGVIMKVLAAAQNASYEKVTVAGAPLTGERQAELRSSSPSPVEASPPSDTGSLGFEEMY